MPLIQCDYHSDVLGMARSMNVILPQVAEAPHLGVDGVAGDGWPALWLLHGRSDDHTTWLRRTSIERYVAPRGLAVVMPAAGLSYYTDMAAGPRYWTHLTEELPGVCRSMFRLSARREDNFVAGLSMGGYGAFKWAMRRPEMFAAAASLSGVLDIAYGIDTEHEQASRRDWQGIFGDLNTFAGSDNDTMALAKRFADAAGPKPALYQCCGSKDFLIEHSRRFNERATGLGLDHVYVEDPGYGHTWEYWDLTIQRVLEWLPLGDRGRTVTT